MPQNSLFYFHKYPGSVYQSLNPDTGIYVKQI